MRLLVLLLLVSFKSFAGISPERQMRLDSIVTNIDKNILKQLDSLHSYLHRLGSSDQERVFMFYGLFATHYKYDKSRMGKKNAPHYSTYYTANKRSGVCRDFANLFKDLCDRSKIPCVVAYGLTENPWFQIPKALVTGKLKGQLHAWNVVKYENSWHLMDPTWSTISRTEKFYGKNEKGQRIYLGKIEIPVRTYYDIKSSELYSERTAFHPAYLADQRIPTYKTQKKKIKHQKVEDGDYNYDQVLMKLARDPDYKFSEEYFKASKLYSRKNMLYYDLSYYFGFLEMKRTKDNAITVELCESHLAEFKKIIENLKGKKIINLEKNFISHELLIKKRIAKLKKVNSGIVPS